LSFILTEIHNTSNRVSWIFFINDSLETYNNYPNNHLVCYGNLISMLEPKKYSQLEVWTNNFHGWWNTTKPIWFISYISEQYDQISFWLFFDLYSSHWLNIWSQVITFQIRKGYIWFFYLLGVINYTIKRSFKNLLFPPSSFFFIWIVW
jgi:hypothetical protein